jgi:2-polyprenyl-3-methyl-5-hydroxy-6-metoxy-1,4-benzoquinol methylase
MKKKNIKLIEFMNKAKTVSLGKHTSEAWIRDPKHLGFTLARYKFVSKMFDNFNLVLEIGAGDGFGSRVVKQNVKELELSDSEKLNIKFYDKKFHKTKYFVHDPIKKKFTKLYDGIYLLDVIEHIDKKQENKFLRNIMLSLKKHGVIIIGTPSLESQKYASKAAKIGHINCKSFYDLKNTMQKFFYTVFMFSMNDEMIHTGFYGMSHYVFAVCTNKK